MPTYVKVHTGTLKIEATVSASAAPVANPAKPWVWRELVDTPPAFDSVTQTRAAGTNTLNGSTLTVGYVVADIALAAAKANAKARAKADCEAKRAGFLTVGYGKMLEYREKAGEVSRWDAGVVAHTAANFPMLEATRAGRGLASLTAARDLIAGTLAAWRAIGAAVCQAEDTATTAITAAADCAAVRAAMAALAATLAGI